MTWREGHQRLLREWTKEGDDLKPEDMRRIAEFYDRMVHAKSLDDEMPEDLVLP